MVGVASISPQIKARPINLTWNSGRLEVRLFPLKKRRALESIRPSGVYQNDVFMKLPKDKWVSGSLILCLNGGPIVNAEESLARFA